MTQIIEAEKTFILVCLTLWLSTLTMNAKGQKARCFLNKKTDAVLKIDHENEFILVTRTLPLMGHRYINIDKGFVKETDDMLIFSIVASGGFLPEKIDPRELQEFIYPYMEVYGNKEEKKVYLKWKSERLKSCSCKKKQLNVIESFQNAEKKSLKKFPGRPQ